MFEDLKKIQKKNKKKKKLAQRAKTGKAQGAVKKAAQVSKTEKAVKGESVVSTPKTNVSLQKESFTVNKEKSDVAAKAKAEGSAGTKEGATVKAKETAAVRKAPSAKSASGARVKAGTAKAKKAAAVKKRRKSANPNTSMGYQDRIRQHRRDVIKKGAIAAGVAICALIVISFFIEKGSYHNYRIIETSEQEDIISTSYMEMDGKILRYTPEGASLVDAKLQTHWSELYDMENPVADVCGKAAVIADQDGTTIKIFNKDGLTGTVTTSYNIVKVHVSANGLVAAILDGGDETWINYYASDGSLIAENQTKIEDPGYPMDVTVSEDGNVMMIAYQFVDGGDTTSYVAFYNFGDVGQNEDDRIVSGYTYEGIVVPQVEYLADNRYTALRDDGFTVYKGKQIPKESATINVEEEIISTFHDDETIGLVFKSGDKDKPYTMQVYASSGKLKFEKNFNIPYTTIKMSGNHIIMYNSSQMCVLNDNGVEKYSGTIDGTIKNLFKIGWNRYLLVLDTGVNVIKFS